MKNLAGCPIRHPNRRIMRSLTNSKKACMAVSKPELGNTYGFLTVIQEGPMYRNLKHWVCVCKCGNVTKPISGANLRNGNTMSCGCARKIFNGARTHGMSGHPALESYKGAKSRCTCETDFNYKDYGGRGIEFLLPSFEEFWAVMKDTWFKGATLDRIDNAGNYEIGNIRWATRKEQCLNTRKSVMLTHDGVTKNLSLWAEDLGISSSSLRERIERWGVEKALSTKKQANGRFITYNGETLTKSQWAERLGIDLSSMIERLDKWPLERALTETKRENYRD